jgi:hypothetical protein
MPRLAVEPSTYLEARERQLKEANERNEVLMGIISSTMHMLENEEDPALILSSIQDKLAGE